MILLLAVGSLDSQCKIAIVRFNAGKRGERKELSALPVDGEMECDNRNISDDEYLFTLVYDPKPNPHVALVNGISPSRNP
jgi:hypothetical protein